MMTENYIAPLTHGQNSNRILLIHIFKAVELNFTAFFWICFLINIHGFNPSLYWTSMFFLKDQKKSFFDSVQIAVNHTALLLHQEIFLVFVKFLSYNKINFKN